MFNVHLGFSALLDFVVKWRYLDAARIKVVSLVRSSEEGVKKDEERTVPGIASETSIHQQRTKRRSVPRGCFVCRSSCEGDS